MAMQRITSRQNPRVKNAARLRTNRERQFTGRCLVDGGREILRALAANVRCVEFYVCDELCDSDESHKAVEALIATGAEMLNVTPTVYSKIAFGGREDGIIAMVETPHRSLNELDLSATPLVAVLEGLEKPGNVGAVLRSADAAGVDAIVIADPRTDLYNPNTIRASIGTVFRDNVCTATSAETLAWLRANHLQIVAARPDAEMLYHQADLRRGTAIVLGSEAEGLTTAWRSADIAEIRLPMQGLADSLNVSTTAAILFYEALRQRAKN